MERNSVLLCLAALGLILLSGCSTAYYSAMEKLGREKRHILVDNVEDVQESQAKAQEEFKDALTRIKELYAYGGSDLEKFYTKLKSSYKDCESRAAQIEKRINDVEEVAEDLFKEWGAEIRQISDPKMRNSSKASLAHAKARYQKMAQAMNDSTKGMYPVLTKLKDYVLYLKHNLNAQAVGALGGEMLSIEKEVDSLIRDMSLSIKEAEKFIKEF